MSLVYSLTDPRDRWFSVDKEAHLFGAAFMACAFGVLLAIVASIVIEVIEASRWAALSAERRAMVEDGIAPWPFLTDKASPKDLIADACGILLALVVT